MLACLKVLSIHLSNLTNTLQKDYLFILTTENPDFFFLSLNHFFMKAVLIMHMTNKYWTWLKNYTWRFCDFSVIKEKLFFLHQRASTSHVAAPQHVLAELVGQLLLHFFNLPIFSIVPQGSGHLLIGHFFAVALLSAPAAGQSLLVFGGELEDALVLVHPPDTVAHVAVSEQI